jgi:hypothetical protein
VTPSGSSTNVKFILQSREIIKVFSINIKKHFSLPLAVVALAK